MDRLCPGHPQVTLGISKEYIKIGGEAGYLTMMVNLYPTRVSG